MLFPAFLKFLFGLTVITIGSEILLKGASKIASLLRIRPMVIGLTVVSIGTSLPELAVGLTALNDDMGDIAIGNIAGTNIVNILFILGLSVIIRPLPIVFKSIRVELFAMIIAAVLLFVLSLDRHLSLRDGIFLLIVGIAYIVLIIRSSKTESKKLQKEYFEEYRPTPKSERKQWQVWSFNGGLLFCGIIATIYGADKLVDGAVGMARLYGMSEAVIGLTIIAIGTSAPELATTIVATIRNDRDVAIGNLLGSSITNVLFILAATIILSPKGIDVPGQILWFDLTLAALVAIVCYPVFKSGQMISRKEGIFFVCTYLAYLTYLLFFRN
jgi:cation:H+ antiporter